MKKGQLVLDELRRRMPQYDAYYVLYDYLEEDLLEYSEGFFSIDGEVESYKLGDLLANALEADLIWPDDESPVLYYYADWDSESGVFELTTKIEIYKTSHTSRALDNVRRESEVGQPANAHEFDWAQYEVTLVIEI